MPAGHLWHNPFASALTNERLGWHWTGIGIEQNKILSALTQKKNPKKQNQFCIHYGPLPNEYSAFSSTNKAKTTVTVTIRGLMLFLLCYLHLKKARRVEQHMRLTWDDLGPPKEQVDSVFWVNLVLFIEGGDWWINSRLRPEELVFRCSP